LNSCAHGVRKKYLPGLSAKMSRFLAFLESLSSETFETSVILTKKKQKLYQLTHSVYLQETSLNIVPYFGIAGSTFTVNNQQ
jgi:hypothetical protein